MKLIKFFLFTTIMVLCICMTSAYASVGNVIVTEDWDGVTSVEFTIQTSYADIVAFAVGNNYSFSFGADDTLDDWTAAYIVDVQGAGWRIVDFTDTENPYSVIPDIITPDFLEVLSSDGYIRAFLYYSDSTIPTSLAPNTLYDGFSGRVFGEDSHYVALSTLEGVLTGGVTSAVPVPGAAILLFAGLTGLVGIKRRR